MTEHPEIIRVELKGEIDSDNLDVKKEEIEFFLERSMQDEGKVRVLDLDPIWTLTRNATSGKFDFRLSMYGVETSETHEYAGWTSGGLLKRTSSPSK